jgi:hypothetical protein
MQLLNKCLKYNLNYKHKSLIKTLAVEADTAIEQLNEREQIYMKQIVANNLQKIINTEATQKERTAQK